jgi:hypothetical protein
VALRSYCAARRNGRRVFRWWADPKGGVVALPPPTELEVKAYGLVAPCKHLNRTHDSAAIADTLCHATDELTKRGKVHTEQSWQTIKETYERVGEVRKRVDGYVKVRNRRYARLCLYVCAVPLALAYLMYFYIYVSAHASDILGALALLPSRALPNFLVPHGAEQIALGYNTRGTISADLIAIGASAASLAVGGAVSAFAFLMLVSFVGASATMATPITPWDFALDTNGNIVFESSTMPVVEGAYRPNSVHAGTTCLGFGDVSKLGEHCKLSEVWTDEHCYAEISRGGTLLGWTTHPAYVLRKCACNAHNALCHRHGTKQRDMTRSLAQTLADFIAYLAPAEGDYAHHPMRVFENWLRKWAFGKQKSILHSREWDEFLPHRVKAMVKREINHKIPTKARLIQFYVNLMTQAEFGPAFYALQKTLCEVLYRAPVNDRVDVTFASGMTAQSIGEWMEWTQSRGAVCYYERDGKNWDSSMQAPHADFRAEVYGAFDPELAAFARSCNIVKGMGVFPGRLLRYAMEYTVKSGHNDTTLGNSLINAAIAYASLNDLGIPGSVLVAGDDLIVACYSNVDCETLMNVEAGYGIQPEARVFTDYRHTTFISGMWISDGERIGFVPIPGRLFARLWWTVKPPGKKSLDMYKRGVARGLLTSCGTLPIVRILLRAFDSRGKSITSSKGLVYKDAKYDFGEGIWYSLSLRYALPEIVLRDFEAWLGALPAEPLILVHPVLTRIAEVDLSDISERGRGFWPQDFSG